MLANYSLKFAQPKPFLTAARQQVMGNVMLKL